MSEQSIDPRIVHVASELSVSLGPQAENDGNMEYILDVIAAVDYANETCDRDFVAGVKAARDAVAGCQERGSWILRADALAAIDGVTTRGEGGA